jgi:uroporphyrinogen decarboxylase
MAHLSKRERVDAALRGDSVDRTPVAAWQHFIPAELAPDTLAETSLRYFQQFDWDWLKVNPRSTYYAEAWGNQYDFNDYEGVRPRFISGPVASASDLERIQPISPTGGVFAEHLELLRFIKAGMVDAHFIQTVFSPLSVLAYLIARPAENTQELSRQARYDALHRMMSENPEGTHAALGNIAQTLAGYAAACLESGASGIFFAIVRLARAGVVSQEEYATFGKPYDVQVLQAVQSAPFNMLHLCGEQAYFDLVADYPVHAINWATINQQNPDMAEAQRRTSMAVVGGVDETGVLQHGSPEEVISAAHVALQATNGRKVLLAPGCTTAMDVPAANLHALRRAAEPAA